ncbi:MAG TPA: DUF6516 family protein [Rubrivivax sp.]|nr:DUF6516 family protein [Rubrivivax sp.]
MPNMKAALLLKQRLAFDEDAFAELVIWRLPRPAAGSSHTYKYRLAFIVGGECVLRFDNEAGKGDHRHTPRRELRYAFESPEKLIEDFLREARRIHRENRRT